VLFYTFLVRTCLLLEPVPNAVNTYRQVFKGQSHEDNDFTLKLLMSNPVFRICISRNADPDPDPGFHLNVDPDLDAAFRLQDSGF